MKGLKRMFAGENFFLNHFTSSAPDQTLIIGPRLMGDIIYHRMTGGTLVVQGSSWLASGAGIELDASWQGISPALLPAITRSVPLSYLDYASLQDTCSPYSWARDRRWGRWSSEGTRPVRRSVVVVSCEERLQRSGLASGLRSCLPSVEAAALGSSQLGRANLTVGCSSLHDVLWVTEAGPWVGS